MDKLTGSTIDMAACVCSPHVFPDIEPIQIKSLKILKSLKYWQYTESVIGGLAGTYSSYGVFWHSDAPLIKLLIQIRLILC